MGTGEMPWPQRGQTHYYEKLVLQDKGHINKGFDVCYAVWLGCMKGIGHKSKVLVLCFIQMAIELKYPKGQHPH